MIAKRVLCTTIMCLLFAVAAHAQNGAGKVRVYNTAKQKLMAGKPIIGGTVATNDINIYCAMANAGFDYLWIEMQHSPLTYQEVATMIRACKGSPAVPFIRVPDANEGDIQKAVDIGALGIIVPTVDTVEKAQNAVKWSRYPPLGRRSQGGGQHATMWGSDYRDTINDNMLVVVMIETPIGTAIADQIAAVPGVDVVFAASTDLGNFSGYKQGQPEYEALVTRIHDEVLKAGKKLGGPQAWMNRPGFTFFQGPGEPALIKSGAQVSLGMGPAVMTKKKHSGVAEIEGSEPK